MKLIIKENFGEQRQFEIEAMDWEMVYLRAMNLFDESNKGKIMDDYYYTFTLINK